MIGNSEWGMRNDCFPHSAVFRVFIPLSELRIEVSMSAFLEPLEMRSRFELALAPSVVTGSIPGLILEFPDGDGPMVAFVTGADWGPGIIVTVSFEESNNGTIWSTIAGSSVLGIKLGLAQRTFARTKQKIRCQVAVSGVEDGSADVAVLVGQCCKLF